MTEERVTIRQLARLSGVSIGTVSRALNGYTDVNPETRERIVRLARELDYTPAAAARSLVTQRSHVIGVFLETGEGHPDLQHPFFHEVLVGVKNVIGAGGYDLLLFASERPGNGYGEHSYLKRALHHNVEGVVLFGVDPDDGEVRRLVRSDLACVGVDVELVGPKTEYVISDNLTGIAVAMRHLHDLGHRRIATITGLLDKRTGADRLRAYRNEMQALGLAYRDEYVISDSASGIGLAMRHLHELGHRRIATITGMLDKKPGNDRLRAYRAELQELGLGYRDEYVAYGDFYVDSGHRAMARLLDLDEPPTAVVTASDLMALGAIRAVADKGLSVPHDVSIVGFDDIQLAGHVHPPLTTLRQDKAGLGAEAGRALMALIDGKTDLPEAVTLPVELIVRGSTAAPSSGA
jgi:DNA-binding LacI/PurR family transcriptional regulator